MKALRQLHVLDRPLDRAGGGAERHVRAEIEGDRRRRELAEMRDQQRRGALLDMDDRVERNLPEDRRGGGRQIDRGKTVDMRLHRGIGFQNHAILIVLRVNRRDDSLSEGIIKRVVDRRRRDPKSRGCGAVDRQMDRRDRPAAGRSRRRRAPAAPPDAARASAPIPETPPMRGFSSTNLNCARVTLASIVRSCTGCM